MSSDAPFQRSQYLAIRAAALETRRKDRVAAAAYAFTLARAAVPTPPPARRGLLARLRGKASL